MMKYLIIGGVAGGATTAARLRRMDEQSQIVMFERGEHVSYANCGLPYYIGGTIADRDKLFLQTPQSFGARFNVDVRVSSEVVAINRAAKTISVKKLLTGEVYDEAYDKLVLSPGAEPVRPPLAGINLDGIFTLRNVTDTDRIKRYVTDRNIRRAVVVGAGFIGLEMAENLHQLGILVSIVEMSEQVMTPLDYSMASIVHQHLKTKNVEFFLKEAVTSFRQDGDQLLVSLRSGRELPADMVVLSIGVRPENRLAKEAGLDIGVTGGIKVDEYLQTSDPSIYAVGDAIEFENPITRRPTITYLAGPANRQGRICADNLVLGNKVAYKGSIATAIAKVFDITVGSTGVAGKTLKKEGIPYLESTTHSASHAGYYPGAIPMSIKIMYAPDTGKLYGAQVVGYEGTDKRLDMLATVIKNSGTIYDLIDIEHAYAPPYSSAKDPVNIAGYVAENILKGRMKPIYWRQLIGDDASSYFLLDVRTRDEYQLGTIPGAINIPLDELRQHLNELPKDRPIAVFCAVGLRGHVASRILLQAGFAEVYNLSGGYKTYQTAVQKQSNEDIYANLTIEKNDNIYQKTESAPIATIRVDACGLQCPGPIMKLKKSFDEAQVGDAVEIVATDPGFARDVQSWCKSTGNKLVSVTTDKGRVVAVAQKAAKHEPVVVAGGAKNKTLIVFSDDLDRALASFVLANGAAATGHKVTMFFTFWGLNVIKKTQKPAVGKDIMGRMFGWMMPSSSKGLKLSKMHMLGIGTTMMRNEMKRKGIDSLESLIKQAVENNVEFIACQMSMDVMGVKREELLDSVSVGGVATYMERAEDAGVNLFI